MDLARGYGAKGKFELKGVGIGLSSDPFLIIKLLDSRVLRIISRSLFLAMVIVALPIIGSVVRDSSDALYDVPKFESSNLLGIRSMPLLFKDLIDEGLLKKGHKGLFLSSSISGLDENLQVLNDHGIDFVDSFLDHKSLIPDEAFNFVYAPSFRGVNFINRVLKMDGIMIVPLGNDPLNRFKLEENFKIVYIRRYDSMVVVMRKLSLGGGFEYSQTTRRLCGITEAARKGALKGLEDVLQEPPRRPLAKSSNRKIKFLPNLMGDSLETYDRRVFITDGENGVVDWFYKKYPTRNQYFEIYNVDIEIDKKEKVVPRAIVISDWLRKNVKKEDYVLMKAEAAIVEEMILEKTLCLVDELFLECHNQWGEDDGKKIKSKRAYWQCLELYGRLRDEGVAVHQWWS